LTESLKLLILDAQVKGDEFVKIQMSIALMLSLGASSLAAAQSSVDSTKLTAADLVFEADEKHTKEFHKYFFFHKDGVSYDQALNDFGECDVYQRGPIGSTEVTFTILPRFVSLSENQSYKPYVYNPNDGGVVGAIVGDIVNAPILQKNEAQRLRKCMEYKSYDRYGISKERWKLIHKAKPPNYVKISASIASGPKPTTEKILP